MMPKHVKDLELQGKKVFVRTDYNVPLDSEGQLTDDFRIRSSLPTIEFLLAQGAAVIVASHLGRPKGAVIPEMSLAPVAKRLGELIQAKVIFAPDCVGPEVNALADALQPGQVLLLENLRFHAAETKK